MNVPKSGWTREQCAGCGGPKPAGRGLLYCENCPRVPVRLPGQMTPCRACGTTEGKQPGRQYCDECKALRDWRWTQRRKSNALRVRQPCLHCGGRKGSGHGRKLCDACRALQAAPPMCHRCGQQPVRHAGARLCEACAEASNQRRLARERKRYMAYRDRNTERERERKRRRATEMRNDPLLNARDLERRRMNYRLQAQREGRPVRQSPLHIVPERGALPGWPLAVAIEHLAESSDIATICEAAGIDERLHTAWRRHERSVSLEVADRVLTALDLLWWDVWSEETLRLPLFVVRQYVSALKKQPDGSHIRRRLCIRVVPYGDAGADTGRLEEIRALMVGESREAIAA